MMKNLLTRKEAAARLGISLVTLDEARKFGRIAFIQRVPGGKCFFTEEAIAEYIARCTHHAKPISKACGRTYRQRRTGGM